MNEQLREVPAGTEGSSGHGAALLILIVAWIAAGFGLAGSSVELFHLPLWVWTATIGIWLFAIIGVKVLTATVFVDMSLDDEDGEGEVRHDK